MYKTGIRKRRDVFQQVGKTPLKIVFLEVRVLHRCMWIYIHLIHAYMSICVCLGLSVCEQFNCLCVVYLCQLPMSNASMCSQAALL